jgi:hypothetical protein
MKHRHVSKAALLAASVLLSVAALAARTVTIFNAQSAASGSYTDAQGNAAERTAGYSYVRMQVCGTGFTGTVTAKQGANSTTLSDVKVLTLTGVTGCTAANYVKLNPAVWTGFAYTRTAGSVTVYLELQ